MNKIAREVYTKLKEGKTFQDCETEIDSFQKYLESVLDKYYPSKYRIEGTLKCVFDRDPKLDTDNQIDRYCICNLKVAADSFRRVTQKASDSGLNSTLKKFFIDFVSDIRPFLERFDSNIGYDWLLYNTNVHMSNFYHNLLENLFFSHRAGDHPEEQKVLVTSLPLLLRQSIELKVNRILGLDYWLINGCPDKQSFETSMYLLRRNLNEGIYKKIEVLDIDLLSRIYNWSNLYVHNANRSFPWLMEAAIFYTKPLFSSYGYENENVKRFSSFGAVQVDKSNEQILQIRTEENLRTRFKRKEVEIYWSDRFEVWFI